MLLCYVQEVQPQSTCRISKPTLWKISRGKNKVGSGKLLAAGVCWKVCRPEKKRARYPCPGEAHTGPLYFVACEDP